MIEAETIALKPSSREEQAKDWFNSVLSARDPHPLFQAATDLGVGRLVDGETRAPTRREEAWRFTDLSRVYSRRPGKAPAVLQPAQVALIKEKVKEHTLEVCEGRALVFVDGVFHPEFSPAGVVEALREEGAREGWKVGSIFEFAGEEQQELLREIEWAPEVGMRHTLAAGSLPFACLNQACVKDAACLVVGEKGEMTAPVQFLFVSTTNEGEGGKEGGKEARVSHPRLVVIAKKRSAGKFVQSYIDVGGGVGLANACTTIKVDRRAEVQHLHANEMGGKGQLFDAVSVTTKKMSAYKNVFINVGGDVGRVNFQATMNGTEGRVDTEGLTVSGEEQELDIHSYIHHLRKDGKSNMYQCNIVSGDSHCVFKGRMKLEPRARGVKADQLIRSIMLTDSCTVDAMPTLEVCSGDVDCTHGATVADIDENEAFYLQSRGIGRREARQVLMMGFAAQVYNQVPCERMRKRLGDRLYEVCPEVGMAQKYEYLSI